MIESVANSLDPVQSMTLSALHGLLPRMGMVALMLLITWVVAAGARWATNHFGRIEWLERVLTRSGVLSGLVEPSLSASRRFAGDLMYWCIVLAGSSLTLAAWSDSVAGRAAGVLLVVLPNAVLAALLILGASWLGRYWSRSVLIWMANEGIAFSWRWAALVRIATIAAGVALASEVTGFATGLVRPSFLILLTGCTYAVSQATLPILRLHLAPYLSPEDRSQRSGNDAPPSR